MATRPRNSNENTNANANSNTSSIQYKRAKAIELHGHNCQEINDLLKGIDEDEKKNILNKFRDRMTALQVAVQDNNTDVIRCLLELGANPDKRFNVKIPTPLQYAVSLSNVEAVELLLAASADRTLGMLFEGRVYTPLYTACEKGNFSIVSNLMDDNEILESINDPIQDDPYITPFVTAVLHGHKRIAEFLKDNGAEFEPKQPYTKEDLQEFLGVAVQAKQLNRVKLILDDFEYLKNELKLDFDFDANYYSDTNYSTLYTAVSVPNNVDVVKYLLSKGATFDPNAYKIKNNITAKTEFQRLMENGMYTEYRRFLEPVETPPRRSVLNNTRKQRHMRKTRKQRHRNNTIQV